MVYVPLPRRLVPVSLSLLAAVVACATVSAPAATAQTAGTTTTTTPGLPLPAPPTTAPAAPTTAAPTTTTKPPAKPTTTAKPGSGGVPAVPVGGPPTTTVPPGAPPPPPPDPTPILAQVDGDLDQLAAINDYKPAQALVAAAQSRVTAAGAALLSARQSVEAAKTAQTQAAQGKATADGKLRQMAIAAYIGVGYTTPGLNQPANGNGDQGAGTVSTPGGLTGISAIDAKEMLIIVGQHARQDDDNAVRNLSDAGKTTQAAEAAYRKDQAAVGAAESQLLADQQTLKLITTAAMTPGAAAATPLPNLTNVATGANGATGTTTTTSTTSTTTDATANVAAAAGGTINGAKPVSPPILGQSVLNAAQILGWWNTLNRQPNITVPIDQLINSYATWGAKLGVSYDVAFAQSVVETGYFSFPALGQLTSQDNNFAGIGACDTCAHGWTFPTADTGVEAQLELLREYATDAPLPTGVQNVIGGTGVGGCCSTWVQLAGRWASSIVYGISIMTVYDKMLTWAIPQEEVAVGLIAPTGPTAQGPALAPLPGQPKPAPSSTTTKKP